MTEPLRSLVRVLVDDRAFPAVLNDDRVILLASLPWEDAVRELSSAWLADAEGKPLLLSEVQLRPPISETSRVIAIAQNYPAHAAEAGGASPGRPVAFFKPPSAFVGHGGTIRVPPVTEELDYEGEIAAVIGRAICRADVQDAADAVIGYTIANDGSARDLQAVELAGRPIVDWFSAKSLDGCSSMGPGIVPRDAAHEVGDMVPRTHLNGDVVQEDVGASMYLSPATLVSFISHRVALRPGDVVLTGTPAGVGKARGRYLQDGDVITVSVTSLGSLSTRYVA